MLKEEKVLNTPIMEDSDYQFIYKTEYRDVGWWRKSSHMHHKQTLSIVQKVFGIKSKIFCSGFAGGCGGKNVVSFEKYQL